MPNFNIYKRGETTVFPYEARPAPAKTNPITLHQKRDRYKGHASLGDDKKGRVESYVWCVWFNSASRVLRLDHMHESEINENIAVPQTVSKTKTVAQLTSQDPAKTKPGNPPTDTKKNALVMDRKYRCSRELLSYGWYLLFHCALRFCCPLAFLELFCVPTL